MFFKSEEFNDISTSIPRDIFSDDFDKETLKTYLLQAVIESFVDGILVLTPQGGLVHTNEYARRICNKLKAEKIQSSYRQQSAANLLSEDIWRVCECLIESRELFPDEKIIIESEIKKSNSLELRIRARWLELEESNQRFLLVTLEDLGQTSESIAIADAKKYGLTDREAEVWLLRRASFSYQEIAEHLYITINTVKKHMKNIHAKQMLEG
jgi:DNA-binding CsgD family transcriptional regulator